VIVLEFVDPINVKGKIFVFEQYKLYPITFGSVFKSHINVVEAFDNDVCNRSILLFDVILSFGVLY